MAILKILNEDIPDLRKKSRPVEKINNRILTLLDDMYDTLLEADGIGLASPQVGVLRRIVIILTEENELLEMINPEIIAVDGNQQEIEGCLSSPGKYAITDRPLYVKVRYMNRGGEICEREGKDILARAFCHETDHLNGVLCFDNALKVLSKEELLKMQEEEENAAE